MAKLDYKELNAVQQYSQHAVFKMIPGALGTERAEIIAQAQKFFADVEEAGKVTVRGIYDLTAMRDSADFMIWWHAEDVEPIQAAYAKFRRETVLGRACNAVWSNVALHRPAEFNKSHIPAFLAGEEPGNYICVYPFVRSYEWYLLEEEERRRMLIEHGKLGRDFPQVNANTVASFALGDYEWLLPMEADELTDLVDMMRDLRYTDARMFVKEEVPFYTGRRLRFDEIADVLQ